MTPYARLLAAGFTVAQARSLADAGFDVTGWVAVEIQ